MSFSNSLRTGNLPAHEAAPVQSSPQPEDHSHPLRSHRSTQVFMAQAKTKPDRPDPLVLHSTTAMPSSDRRSPMPVASRGRDRPPFPHVSPVATVFANQMPSKERFGHAANASTASSDIPTIPTRPPLRPTISFGSVSRYSYYSTSSTGLDYKSTMVAVEKQPIPQRHSSWRQDWRFFACFASLCMLNLACGVSTTACSLTLPTIARSLGLDSVQSFWVPGSFLLWAFLSQPLAMRLSLAIGCKSLLILNLLFFTGGSIGSAFSHNVTSLLVSRGLEGAGAGAICVLAQLALNQLVTAAYRKHYERFTILAFWFGAALGSMIGGTAARSEVWRRTFGTQVVIGAFGLLAVPFLLQLPYVDAGHLSSRLLRVDYLGWTLLTASITPILIALSWAGTVHPWTSWHTLVPLIIGLVSMACWTVYNFYRHEPILPISIFRSASATFSCFGALVHGMSFTTVVYFLPLSLQIADNLLPAVTWMALTPFTLAVLTIALLAGFINHRWGYRWSIWIGWAIATASVGLFLVLQTTDNTAASVPLCLACGMGLGLLAPSLASAVQSAASNDDESIYASPLYLFFSTLGQCLGIVLSSSIFLNQLSRRLDAQHLGGVALDAIAQVPTILAMTAEQAQLRTSLVDSYLSALRSVWIVMCVLAGLTFLCSIWFTEDHKPRRPQSFTIL